MERHEGTEGTNLYAGLENQGAEMEILRESGEKDSPRRCHLSGHPEGEAESAGGCGVVILSS